MNDLPKAYEPQQHEDGIYKKWMDSGLFNPDTCVERGITKPDAETFSMVLPPPNVTGTLHLGHAVMLAMQDLAVRCARMRGKKTLWIPGVDHAAIATQSKVEKKLLEEEGKTRHDLGREAFLDRVNAFAQDSHDTIVNQMKKMGASVDWSREAYTLDEPRNRAVRTAFKKMYDDGLIYRGSRIVNWDPNLKTTVSDDEVEYKEERTKFYYFQYGPFVIGTARPETKFGDKYIVMHPDDERYAHYQHGQKLTVEWINGPIEATIIKDEAADKEFGTGVMTITPWHSAIDFDLAQKHHLDSEQIIDFDGKLLPVAEEFAGMHIADAREKIVEKLDKKGLLVKVDDEYVHNLAINSRGGGIIEPQVKEQWFIDVNKSFEQNGEQKTLKSLMQEAVQSGNIEIIPERFNKTYFHWIDNLRDWCISRQIWFGHRIPAFYCVSCQADHIDVKLKKEVAGVSSGNAGALLQTMPLDELAANIEEVIEIRGGKPVVKVEEPATCDTCGGTFFVQDPDTLDTWFSSGLWTFSTLGWPDETDDLKTYHPTTLLETGYDILFFWVARMILMTGYLMNDIPFRHVYLHGLVRDEQGRKMSKSLDNIIDPLDMIRQFGADATRLSLMVGIAPGNDAKLSVEKVAGFRNFANKLYNIGRFVLTTTENSAADFNQQTYDALPWEDQWILGRLKEVTEQTTAAINSYDFARALDNLRDFTWSEFADWYIEIAKIQGNKDAVLRYALDTLLKLWHPAMPFVTEHLWSQFHDGMLMVQSWPEHAWDVPDEQKNEIIMRGEMLKAYVTEIRRMKAIAQKANEKCVLSVSVSPQSTPLIKNIYAQDQDMIKKLARLEHIEAKEALEAPHGKGIRSAVNTTQLLIELSEKEMEVAHAFLIKEIENKEQYIDRIQTKLGNKRFVESAPEDVVEMERNKLEDASYELGNLKRYLK